ncbi:hypothetical protein GGR57DRAFT_469577 [Xylariaceae sp. FL1272]|nr:hypothetical protein GGR57DRAFT_469577 [Xylariaceae sp. FL1272]
MPAAKQHRKSSTMSKVKPSQPKSSSISSFARVSKTVVNTNVKKELTSTPKKDVKIEALTPASRKRKVVTSIEDEPTADERPSKIATPSTRPALSSITNEALPQSAKRSRGRPSKKSRAEPAPRKRVRSPSVSDSEESAIDTHALFKKLRLESSPSRCSSPLTADTSVAGSDSEVDTKPPRSNELPKELLDLIDLFIAFLKTLSLHYAHNGSNVPVDLRVLGPNIARAWGKKRVTIADIRICVGVLESCSLDDSPFKLTNYGRGKVCIEMGQARSFNPLDEIKLNTIFRGNITSLWSKAILAPDSPVSEFVTTLPKSVIVLCESVAKASPILLKGQQRLEDLKHGISIKKQEKAAPKPATDTPMTNADGSKMSLLDRIRMKSLQKSAVQRTGLSAAELERRAALQRVEEVSSLIGMLSRASGESRISFPMAVMMEKLKDSFRMGISKDEGAVCIRLLGAEVAPEWVRVLTLGGREMVVVDVAAEISKVEVAKRVQKILG